MKLQVKGLVFLGEDAGYLNKAVKAVPKHLPRGKLLFEYHQGTSGTVLSSQYGIYRKQASVVGLEKLNCLGCLFCLSFLLLLFGCVLGGERVVNLPSWVAPCCCARYGVGQRGEGDVSCCR